jgi:hypothetical protein
VYAPDPPASMPSCKVGAPLESLRAEMQRQTDAGSLRHVARLVGMSPAGLHSFLEGGRPARGAPAEGVPRSAESVFTLLVQDLPPWSRPAARELLAERMRLAASTPGGHQAAPPVRTDPSPTS